MNHDVLEKQVLKKVIIELLEEKNEHLINAIKEAFEDFALAEAIKEGLKTENISKDVIFKELNDY